MSLSFVRAGGAVLAGCMVIAGGAALAQAQRPAAPAQPLVPQVQPGAPQPPTGPSRVDLVGLQADWTKVCGHDPTANKDVCYTTRDFGTAADQQPAMAVAVYEVKGDEQRIVRLLLPVGLLLKPGFRFAIDKGAALEGDFDICFPNGCFAESRVKSPTIDQLKKGISLNVAVKNQANAEVTFTLPLSGFGKAFDGPAIDPKLLQQQQQALQDELQKRADAERQRLEGTPANPPAAAPAPSAPPAHLPIPATPKR